MFKINTTSPGPGTYAAIGSIKADGNYAPSAFQRTKTPLIKKEGDVRPKKHDRVPFLGKYAPGPGWYDLSVTTMSSKVSRKNLHPNVA